MKSAASSAAHSGTQNFPRETSGVVALDQDGFAVDNDGVVAASAEDEATGTSRKIAEHGDGFNPEFIRGEDHDVGGLANVENSTIIEAVQSSWF